MLLADLFLLAVPTCQQVRITRDVFVLAKVPLLATRAQVECGALHCFAAKQKLNSCIEKFRFR